MPPDVVYVMGPQHDREDSLRYSLRSLETNGAEFGKVWIVGTVPEWTCNVERLPLTPLSDKFENQRQSLESACAADGMADTFVLFNDDHFVVDKLDEWPVFHLSSAFEYVEFLLRAGACGSGNTWLKAVRETAEWMKDMGHEDVNAYEAHVPLPFQREKLQEMLHAYPNGRRLAVGEMYAAAGAGGEGVDHGNAKVQHIDPSEFHRKVAQDLPFLSSNAKTFDEGLIGGYIRGMFRTPSRFEK